MNMRQHKRWIMARQLAPWALVFAGRRIMARDAAAEIELGDIQRRMNLAALVEPAPAAVVFTVARKKDGEIVGTFDSLEQAQAEIDKAKKAKKAALVLV